MEVFADASTASSFNVWLLMLLLHVQGNASLTSPPTTEEDDDEVTAVLKFVDNSPAVNIVPLLQTSIQNFQFCSAVNMFDEEITYWVRPRSTTWFSRFLIEQYDSSRWLSMFRMTKDAVFALAQMLEPHVQKKDTNYRLAVPVLVRVCCALFKLTHGANYTICSEMFAIGRSTVSKILREVVQAINECCRDEIKWPCIDKLCEIQDKFQDLCSLPGVVGAIDGVHFSISKPCVSPAEYFYFKKGGYSINCQAVVDSEKRFLDLYVGMPGSTNDARMLRRSTFYHLASHGHIMDDRATVDRFSPYVIADVGYPLLPWMLVPHRQEQQLSLAENMFNRILRKGRMVVENAFGILKQSFRELQGVSELDIAFFPDVVVCCCILHYILLRQSHEDIEDFLRLLDSEGMEVEAADAVDAGPVAAFINEDVPTTEGAEKRHQLGVYLTTRRRHGA